MGTHSVANIADREEKQEALAKEMTRLYVVDETHWYSQQSGGAYRHQKEPLSLRDLQGHLRGEVTVGVPCTWEGCAKFISIDVDTLDPDNIAHLGSCLKELDAPYLLSFSGNKGYHADLLLEECNASNAAKAVLLLKRLLRQTGVSFDQVTPTRSGLSGRTPGGPCVKLPLGWHRKTGSFCHCLDADLRPIDNVSTLIRSLQPIPAEDLIRMLAERVGLDLKTGELTEHWDSLYPLELHHSKPCVNILWRGGLQAPGTRHSAAMVIINAVLLNQDVPFERKEQAVIHWVGRTHPTAIEKGYSGTRLMDAEREARRLFKREEQHSLYGVTCKNSLLRPAMASACADQIGCHMERNWNKDSFILLTRLGVFAPRNSLTPGIAKSAGYVYLALRDLMEDFGGKFTYLGMPAVAAPLRMLEELACCTRATVKKALRALQFAGLVVKVPKDEVPPEYRRKRLPGHGFPLQASYYVLSELTEELVREVVGRVRDYRKGR